jgi:two-component system, chemotaxis family, chemotaxis protein CheY
MAIKFLVVDDSLTMRRIVVNALKAIGYESVIEAADGKEAFGKLQAEGADFVISDWNMPEMNGLDLVKSIRTSTAYSDTPVLMVTTRGNKDDVIEAMQARVNNYIVKPFTPQALKEKLDQILKTTSLLK